MILRGKVIAFVLLSMLFSWRWTSMEGLLPDSWTPESEVRYTARILEKPSHTDSQTIIRDSRWKIILWGYEPLVVGEEYVFSGRVEPRVTANKQVQIVMMDPSFEIVPTPLARGGDDNWVILHAGADG